MSTPSPEIFEKLASFYLGREYDLAGRELLDNLLMYDAKDLCTHAMCVGMTGSGKTGLCLSLLEEAAIDGIPAICLDPKGDLGNLLLTFPELKPSDFKPWLEEGEAKRKGMDLDTFAEKTATTWKTGLASWGQAPERIQKFRDSVDIAIYTPGSNIGLPLTVLKSFDAPPPELLDDTDAMRERITGAASGLLTLMGIQADPLLSREHILISSILDHCWRQNKSVTIGDLIRLIQSPPIDRVGVLDLETFMPATDRVKIAMQLNNLLASPAFSSWLDGEPLSIKKLLYTDTGKPRLSILSIAHLSDTERMFFVTILLNELVAWMRTQSGTSSLRAIFYMDEVFGYFPPSAIPPSKPPMLTLLKQARAFGLGIALATQNPVDLDYKGLSNIGTWFLGRLQTERDKARVLEGLEGAAVQSGQKFDRGAMERMLASLGTRVFLMNNVHEDAPTVFQSRWALSFLAGPLARGQITKLMSVRKGATQTATANSARETATTAVEITKPSRPVTPSGVKEAFAMPTKPSPDGGKFVYRPAVYAEASMHFVRAGVDLDIWVDAKRIVRCESGVSKDFWEDSSSIDEWFEFEDEPRENFAFSDLPTPLRSASNLKDYKKQLGDYLYRHHPMQLYKSTLLKDYAPAGCDEVEARLYFENIARESRDAATDKIRDAYAAKMKAIDTKLRAAEAKHEKEKSEAQEAWLAPAISIAGTLLGAFVGRKSASRSNVTRMESAARGASRVSKQREDVRRAEETMVDLANEMTELDLELKEELDQLAKQYDVKSLELETTIVPPRKGDLKLSDPMIVWLPWHIDPNGIASLLVN